MIHCVIYTIQCIGIRFAYHELGCRFMWTLL